MSDDRRRDRGDGGRGEPRRAEAGRRPGERSPREGRYGERGPRDRDDRPRRDRDDRGRPQREDRPRRDRDDRPRRAPEPELPEDIEAGQLDKELRAELKTLSKDNAEGVARHLVAVGRALDAEDFERALAHAQEAGRRAGRVAGVRETLGVVHYRRGEWAKALAEFRTARRLSGQHHLLPLMADTERGLGRPERALELAASPEAARLDPADRVELAIVVSGARADMGQTAAAVQSLRELAVGASPKAPWAARLRYAYAAALEADGSREEAREWYVRAAALDQTGETDARELLGVEEEPEVMDLAGDEPDRDAPREEP